MKKAFILLICISLVLGSMVVSTSASVSPDPDDILWDAETSDGGSAVVGEKTEIKNGYIFDDASWNGYDMIGKLFPEIISNKVVNLSFDYKPDGVYLGAPCFVVDVFTQNTSYATGASGWYLGFYAYDQENEKDDQYTHDHSSYYDDKKTKFTYYGNMSRANSEPYDASSGTWVNGTAPVAWQTWQHIDCVYDLKNMTVTYYVNGTLLGSSKGPNAIGAIGFRKQAQRGGKSVYYGVMNFDNVRLTEVKAEGLVCEAETEVGKNSFLLNFSEPVNTLTNDMVTLTDMETIESVAVSSVEKVTPYQWRVNVNNVKQNAEYKFDIASVISDFGGTPKAKEIFAYTDDAASFGVKKVRYDEKISNYILTSVGNHTEDFSTYTTAADPAENKTNTNDYAVVSNGMWERYGHAQSISWWGQGTYVNSYGKLSIDSYNNTNPFTVGTIRKINDDGSAIKDNKILTVNFDMSYYVLERHDGSYFTLYAGDYPIFVVDRQNAYLYDEQLFDEKILLGANTFDKSKYGTDLKDVELEFDFLNKEITINYGGVEKTTKMCDELAEAGFSSLKFAVRLANGIEGALGDYRGNAFVMDNYSDELFVASESHLYNSGVDASKTLATTTSKINVEFTHAVDENTIENITISDENGNEISYTPALSANRKTLSLGVTLKQKTSYTLTIPTSVVSADGVAIVRDYAFSFTTDSAIKFYDEYGVQLTDAELESASYARYEISAPAPTDTEGKCFVISAVFDETNNNVKKANVNEISYKAGDIIEDSGVITLEDGEFAKVFFWKSLDSLEPVLDECYSIGIN